MMHDNEKKVVVYCLIYLRNKMWHLCVFLLSHVWFLKFTYINSPSPGLPLLCFTGDIKHFVQILIYQIKSKFSNSERNALSFYCNTKKQPTFWKCQDQKYFVFIISWILLLILNHLVSRIWMPEIIKSKTIFKSSLNCQGFYWRTPYLLWM